MAMNRRTASLLAVALAVFMASARSDATYNANISGVVSHVLTYDGPDILFRLNPMPAGLCSEYFVIPGDVPTEARQQLLARLLLAYSSREPVNIGYDNVACHGGRYRVHRVG